MSLETKIIEVWEKEWQKDLPSDYKHFFTNRLFIEVYQVLNKYLNLSQQTNILEIGAGTGRYGIKFALANSKTSVVITDPTNSAITLIAKMVDHFSLTNVLVKRCFSEKMPFADKTFSLVFGDVVIQHIVNPLPALVEIFRVLKNDGQLILTVVNSNNPFHSLYKYWLKLFKKQYDYVYEKSYSRKSLNILLDRAGFKIIYSDGAYPAYGLYRHKYKYSFVAVLAKMVNRLTKLLDKITGNFFRKYFGFVIIVVAVKK